MPKTSAKDSKDARPRVERVTDLLRLPTGPVDLAAIDTAGTPGFDGGKKKATKALATLGPRLADLQERLYAEGRTGGTRSLLLVLQGMDTSGKGGTVRHVVGQVDPQGVSITAFKAPTKEELAHDFLWRVKKRLPAPGMLGVFDRSHYEDVVVARVRELVEPRTWKRRYGTINRFEESLVANGTTVVKCFLHISKARVPGPAAPAPGQAGEAVEVQPRRRRLPGRVGTADRGLLGRPRALQQPGCPLARRAGRSQVVPELGDHEHPGRAARGDVRQLARSGLRRGGAAPPPAGGGVAGSPNGSIGERWCRYTREGPDPPDRVR